jgi:hypothetical protein
MMRGRRLVIWESRFWLMFGSVVGGGVIAAITAAVMRYVR